MRKKIEKQIIDEVKSVLLEYDIEGMVAELTNMARIKKEIRQEIDNKIREEVVNMMLLALQKAIRKQQPIVDAMIDNDVRGFMMRFTKFMEEV